MPPYPLPQTLRSDNMYRTRRQASHTLPRNFTFHYTDVDPTTPEPQDAGSPPAPPSPPRQMYRIKRRRGARQLSSEYSHVSELPIPTIELPDSANDAHGQSSFTRSRMGPRRRSLPRTPSAQVRDVVRENSVNMEDGVDAASQGESISRPSTACSGFSDSSASSSVESFPSLGGSFTSPELDQTEAKKQPDLINPNHLHPTYSSEPLPQLTAPSTQKRPKSKWTEDMDNHLWMTYLRYMQDATKTPFRTAPGAPPPLGICSRIIREAKRTWKGSRSTLPDRLHPWSRGIRGDSPDTIKPATSGSTTPTDAHRPKLQLAWPRSDASTRRRFRELFKKRSMHLSHNNRMLTARTSPLFGTSSSSNNHVPNQTPYVATSSFSTRDMSISLFSSTSNAVSALNNLTTEATPSNLPGPSFGTFTAATPRVGSHQKSQSLHLGDSRGQGSTYLASPFQPRAGMSYQAPHNQLETSASRRPSLGSPLQFDHNNQVSGMNSFGRRPDQGNGLEPFPAVSFIPPLQSGFRGISARRIRTRGFSLGDVNESSRRLTQIFDPPVPVEQATAQPNIAFGRLAPPPTLVSSASIRRLGSPFSEQPKAHFHTFPRNISLHGSLEPTLEVQEDRSLSDFSMPDKAAEK